MPPRDSYTVLLNYRAKFHAQHILRYAAYVLLPQSVAKSNAKTVWYDLKAPDEVKSESEGLHSNWCAFRTNKGSARTFEYGRASCRSIGKLTLTFPDSVDTWLSNCCLASDSAGES